MTIVENIRRTTLRVARKGEKFSPADIAARLSYETTLSVRVAVSNHLAQQVSARALRKLGRGVYQAR